MAKSVLAAGRLHLADSEMLDFQYMRTLAYEPYGAASVGEVFYVASQVARRGGTRDDYIAAWTQQSDRVATYAAAALSQGRRLAARTYYLRAYNYLRAAEFDFHREFPEEHAKQYAQCVAYFDQAAALLDHPVEKVQIPYLPGIAMPGYVFKPTPDDQPRPTVIISGGGDGYGEELYLMAGVPDALARGFNVIVFHGPGQRGLLIVHPDQVIRPDAEVHLGKVIDYALSRPDVDGDRLALYGLSFGGYMVIRAAAHDKRIKALIPSSPIREFHPLLLGALTEAFPDGMQGFAGRMAGLIPDRVLNGFARRIQKSDWAMDALIDNYMLWNNGVRDFAAFVEHAKLYTNVGFEQQIACPTLCLYAQGEGGPAQRQAREFHDLLRVPKRFVTLSVEDGADNHVGLNNIAHTSAIVYDWVNEVLAP